ncbi:response regulator [Mangrovitalea sediminis]|uniref:response regulator n=1 Tax=Mangrovitalea sediminis TaxID=1982043 RepID=UPI000BE52BA8|nr:response regulator transcription factor [Mangrovitalea sediminis]
MASYRVGLVEDQHIIRAGLCSLVESFSDFSVVAEGADGDDVPRMLRDHQIDVLIMDIAMKRVSGLEALALIRKHYPEVPVIMLSMYGTKEFIFRALQDGAAGYVMKDGAVIELHLALRSVLRGERYLSPRISSELVNAIFQARSDPFGVGEVLSPRQLEVLRLIALGKATKEIAFELGLSAKTVDTHRLQIMSRLQIHDIPGLIFYALRNGIISLDLIQ